MSIQEKRTLASLATGVLVIAAYLIYTVGKLQSGLVQPEDLRYWAGTMLIFIGIGIIAAIVLQIVFCILLSVAVAVKKQVRSNSCNDEEISKTVESELAEDEMVKLIQLKAMRIGFAIAGFGFIAALVSLLFGCSAAVMLNIIFLSFSAGSLAEGFTQLYYYRKGVSNG